MLVLEHGQLLSATRMSLSLQLKEASVASCFGTFVKTGCQDQMSQINTGKTVCVGNA